MTRRPALRGRLKKAAGCLARLLALFAVAGLLALGVLLGLRAWVEARVREQVFAQVEDVPPQPVALVLGAGLRRDGSLTPVLADRVAAAADLYHTGKVRKLLCSGDNRFEWYNEPESMRRYALQLGVPEEDIVLDYAGRRTYDSCYRARAIFGVEQAVVVTQRFHVARSVYLCEALGVEAVGLTADRQPYSRRQIVWLSREYLAVLQAWLDVNLLHPLPVLGEPLPIFSEATEETEEP